VPSPTDASTIVIVPVPPVSVEVTVDVSTQGVVWGLEPVAADPKPDMQRARPKPAVQPDPASADTSAPPVFTAPASVEPQAEKERTSAGSASRGISRGPLPLEFPPLQARSSSVSGGGSASSLLLFGFAALIGFFVLAAPGLGRRIRLARYPRPRGRDGSSIDRPG
jgi:hypothetical protein